jgi:23S rRNA pseudouridine1911/1915/1917 synthase
VVAPITVTIAPEEDGIRIDRVLAERKLGYSRAAIQRFLEAGRVSAGGGPITQKHRARAGEAIAIEPLPPEPTEAAPEELPLEILHRDDDIVVVNKPAGLVVHPAAGHASGTLVNAVLFHAPVTTETGDLSRPGIVHRIDKDTSGVLVVARTDHAKNALVAAFASHAIERRYLAIACGDIGRAFTIDAPIARHPTDRKRFTSKTGKGKRAVTHVTPLERFALATSIECRLETGRTHQIRVHLADHGAPLLGDRTYGGRGTTKELKPIADALGRQALHAAVLGFIHPRSGRSMRFEVPPPPDFQRALEAIRAL